MSSPRKNGGAFDIKAIGQNKIRSTIRKTWQRINPCLGIASVIGPNASRDPKGCLVLSSPLFFDTSLPILKKMSQKIALNSLGYVFLRRLKEIVSSSFQTICRYLLCSIDREHGFSQDGFLGRFL